MARLESYTPPWPLPKIFRMTKGGKLIDGIFVGETINTPSMLCVEDYLDALNWAKSLGGLKALMARADANFKVLADWAAKTPWIDFFAADPATRSNTSVCLKIVDPAVTALDLAGAGGLRPRHRRAPRQGGRRLRHRLPPRRPAALPHLGGRDDRGRRPRGADRVARLGLRGRESRR